MLKLSCLFIILTASVSVNAAIIDLGDITRDTGTGLDWLDVTETTNQSYNQVTAQMVAGGALEGWRYASPEEFEQLVLNFGIAPNTYSVCSPGIIFCGTTNVSNSMAVENAIWTLGDTRDQFLDSDHNDTDVSPEGAGYTMGILGSQMQYSGHYDVAIIEDSEEIVRGVGYANGDQLDQVNTLFDLTPSNNYHWADLGLGSYLVQVSPVPLPASGLLFMGAISLFVGRKFFSRR